MRCICPCRWALALRTTPAQRTLIHSLPCYVVGTHQGIVSMKRKSSTRLMSSVGNVLETYRCASHLGGVSTGAALVVHHCKEVLGRARGHVRHGPVVEHLHRGGALESYHRGGKACSLENESMPQNPYISNWILRHFLGLDMRVMMVSF